MNNAFITEDKNKKDIEVYNKRLEKELDENYGVDIEKPTKEKRNLARYINEHFNDMKLNDMIKLLQQCMTEKQIKKTLLEFEFKYIDVIKPRDLDLDEFVGNALKILKRYQCKAGGYYIEDTDWIVHRKDSVKYDVKNNEVLFENSVDKIDFLDNETQYFIKRIASILNGLSNDIDVDYDFSESKEDGITWVLIWCKHKKIKQDTPNIEL